MKFDKKYRVLLQRVTTHEVYAESAEEAVLAARLHADWGYETSATQPDLLEVVEVGE